jgi:hypothetical protein
MEISREEFQQWKENPVTRAVYEVIDGRITDAKDILASNAGEDQRVDSILVGMIRAFNEMKEVSWDD